MEEKRIPVTIITGFLGAGKTTLLNQLIREYPDKKFAIIENEFGQVGIDGGLIVGVDENVFELANGCICCSLNEDFYATLRQLHERSGDFNHLLIETTGIADPDSIIRAFVSTPDIQAHYELDSVIALADAVHMEDLLEEQAEVRKQLAVADTILLNKVDAVQAPYAQELVKSLAQINPAAAIHSISHGLIKGLSLLDSYSFSKLAIHKSTLAFRNLRLATPETRQETKHQIGTEGFVIPGDLDMNKFSYWIHNYLFFNQASVYRVKGILSIAGEEEQYIFQAVGTDMLAEKGPNWGKDQRFSKIIFIGKYLDRDALEDNLYQLLV